MVRLLMGRAVPNGSDFPATPLLPAVRFTPAIETFTAFFYDSTLDDTLLNDTFFRIAVYLAFARLFLPTVMFIL